MRALCIARSRHPQVALWATGLLRLQIDLLILLEILHHPDVTALRPKAIE